MPETLVLDPTEITGGGRTQLDISDPSQGVYVAQAGPDWGDSSIEAYMADQVRGATPIDFRIPNRQIVMPIIFKGGGTVTTDQARAKLQSKVARIQQEGGWLKRVVRSGGTVYLDVVNASLTLGDQWHATHMNQEPGAVLTLEAIPDFYGNETQLSDHTETSNPELVFTETGIDGDYPARVRVVVDDDQAQDQRGLIWHFRSRHYSSATTAKTFYEAESLQALDTARILAGTAVVGGTTPAASGGTVVSHGTISTSWTPVVGTNVGGTSYLTHTGTNRIYARIYSTSGTTVQTRFVWDVGDLVNPAENAAVRLPGAPNFYIVDYGEVRLDPPPVGTHRWQGQIQAKGDVGTEQFAVDRVWIVNQDEGAGVLRAPINLAEGVATYSARSEFNTESGAITGDTLAVGGTWQAGTGSDTDDFSVGSGVATRSTTSDSGTNPLFGRAILASSPTTLSNVIARVDFKASNQNNSATYGGLLLRYGAANTNLQVTVTPFLSSSTSGVSAVTFNAGASATLKEAIIPSIGADTWRTLWAMVLSNGWLVVWVAPKGSSPGAPVLTGQSSLLATGGALDDGQVGIYDDNRSSTSNTRTYDNFSAWVPSVDAVTFASRSTQLTTQGHYRIDSGGTAYGPVSVVAGDIPRLPVAGLDGRTVEVFLKASRGDLDIIPDNGIDDISARVNYRPSWLFNPEP